MNKRALKTLEYDKIIAMLRENATSDPGRQLCDELLPGDNPETVENSVRETADALNRIRLFGNINFGDARNMEASLKRVEIGAGLSIPELLHIGALLGCCARVRSYGMKELSDSLSGYFESLNPVSSLSREIFRCIESEDTLSDNASAELSKIRKKIKNIDQRMHSELNSILASHRTCLQDSIIAMRNNCYCLPVKSEYKNKVPGVVHDQSATGSTVFIEPMEIIKLNNERRELVISEKAETDKILMALSFEVLPESEAIRQDYILLAHLDFVYAKAGLAGIMKATRPLFNNRGYIELKDARHPLIAPDSVVPISIRLGEDFDLLIITGPNTGGKTVSLKTLGLFTLMGQAGLFIPAFEGSSLSVFKEVFADIGDEQSIEQSLSTFSGHMKHIVEILKNADEDSLCLFDELGAGTDPTEGAALAISILSFLHRMQVKTAATTHYSELKVFALGTPRVENACCEFDVETLKPTYRILIGIPGKSNAFAISQKLGLADFIIEEAKTHIGENDIAFEDLLTKLEDERLALEKERAEAEVYRKEASALRAKYEKQDENLDARRDRILREAREEAHRILSEAKDSADASIRSINRISSDAGLLRSLEKERSGLRDNLKNVESSMNVAKAKNISRPAKPADKNRFHLGDKVKIISLNHTGIVSSLPNEKGNFFVQMGILRSQVNIGDVELVKEETVSGPGMKKGAVISSYSGSSQSGRLKSADISRNINLIGMNVDDAVAALDKYLDDARLSHLSEVRVIHGRGTGALRQGIHAYLKKQKDISGFQLAEYDDGGTAVTVVKI